MMHFLQKIRRLVTRKNGTAKITEAKTQNDSCTFLQLPADIMYLVFQELESEHRRVLALTCRALHGFHSMSPNLRNKCLTQDQHLEYLACIARSLPEQWVCDACLKLHPFHPLDTPGRQNAESMVRPRKLFHPLCKFDIFRSHDHPVDRRHVQFQHHHVQLALKHLRLSNKPSEYAKRLLAVHHHDHFDTHDRGLFEQEAEKREVNTLATRYSVYPRAKMGADGQLRYLTLSTWLYQSDIRPVSLEAMGNMKICPHMGFEPHYPPSNDLWPEFWCYGYRPDTLAQAIEKALAQQQDNRIGVTEIRGACPRCPTDFAIQASPNRVELLVWRDLGPEGSPRSLAWRIHVFNIGRDCPNDQWNTHGCSTLHHVPGSVRALYDGTDTVAYSCPDGPVKAFPPRIGKYLTTHEIKPGNMLP
ncbi:hypothetical protein DL546_000031 [Coniochaeta pulveracea]|uniref:F-box domain-containing protein n=1 Tax=Coniochaeta pulveracea TaxID=177199 RepID=A0A420Y901_9PEZI|nr:hypothetical protein DL546_000031 [Coniochaeta pulveracea]